MKAVIENYRVWRQGEPDPGRTPALFDTVAVYLTFSREYLKIERMGLAVDEKGFTVTDSTKPAIDVALEWIDMEAYKDFLVERLCLPVVEGK
jgi:hypothetical protein